MKENDDRFSEREVSFMAVSCGALCFIIGGMLSIIMTSQECNARLLFLEDTIHRLNESVRWSVNGDTSFPSIVNVTQDCDQMYYADGYLYCDIQ
jgi:hypothetical protein